MFLPSRCFLLLIGDDGALLLPPRQLKETGPLAAADHSENAAARLITLMRQKPNTPVILLADTHAQHLKLETLPPVARLDRRKLTQKRLEQAFGKHAYKTSHPLGKDRTVLVAVEEDGPLVLWQERLATLPNPIGGVTSLPLEAASMLTRLRPETAKGWAILILWQRSGGFRQIVTRDGKMVFTRMTSQYLDPAVAQSSLDFLATDIDATQGYLARFGLPSDKKPNLTALLPPSLGAAFTKLSTHSDCLVLSPHEAALRLGLTPAFMPKEPYCDTLSAQWVAERGFFQRLMIKPQDHSKHLHRLLHKAGFITGCILLALSLEMTLKPLVLASFQANKVRTLTHDIAELQEELKQTQKAIAPATEPLGRLRLAIQKRRLFEQTQDNELALLFPVLDEALAGLARAEALDWRQGELALDLRLKNTPVEQDKDAIVAQFEMLAKRLREATEGYSIRIERYPFPALPQETLTNAPLAQPVARYVISKETQR